MAQKKKEDRKRSLKKPRLIVTVAVTVLIAAIFLVAIQAVGKYREKEMFMSLRNDMKSLQVEFEKVDAGWEYQEYCRGYGSDVARSNALICYSGLINIGDTEGSVQGQYDAYIDILAESQRFTYSSNAPPLDTGSNSNIPKRITAYIYVSGDIPCKLADTQFYDKSSKGLTFTCSASAQESYYNRDF